MQKIRLWEISPDQKLAELTSNQISLEERLEDWLASDISVLDPNLLVIGRQVDTDFGGTIDLLCLDSAGDTVVVELKKGKTPREVTAQALDYASWVKDLSVERLAGIADDYFRSPDSLVAQFQNNFGEDLPSELNLNHRSLVVAEEIDAGTERIVRYLSDMNVPVNVATVQHFRDKDGREILAQVYLIKPEVAEAKSKSASKRTPRKTLAELQTLADDNGIGELYRQVRDGVRGVLSAHALTPTDIGYATPIDGGGRRTVLIISAAPSEEDGRLRFTVHATRFNSHLGVQLEELLAYLPGDTRDENVKGWVGSSPDEREKAIGLTGSFQSVGEVETFLAGLRSRVQSDS